eukprot:10542091-Ditylum_brightwellii.AAC.1
MGFSKSKGTTEVVQSVTRDGGKQGGVVSTKQARLAHQRRLHGTQLQDGPVTSINVLHQKHQPDMSTSTYIHYLTMFT